MQFLLDLGFWHSVEEAWTRLFQGKVDSFVYPKKMKKSHILTEEGWSIIFVPICLILTSILFQFIFASFFLVRPSWGSDKSIRKSSSFFEFSRIIAHKISIDLASLWCKLFLVLLPRSWIVLVFLPRSPKIFLDFFPRSRKILQNLANLAKNNCQDLGQKCQNQRNFLARKPRCQALGGSKIINHRTSRVSYVKFVIFKLVNYQSYMRAMDSLICSMHLRI